MGNTAAKGGRIMLAYPIEPVVIDPSVALDAATAFVTLAGTARRYLEQMEQGVVAGALNERTALVTRVRGTGPGASFGELVNALMQAHHEWVTPFEKSDNVSGAVIRGRDVVGEERDDAFLLLQFSRQTLDLPLHIHMDSDRFIVAIGGRGYFHLAETGGLDRIKHIAVRDRDALMFRRGTEHTFSTDDHTLMLLSYHSPYVPLEDERQYLVPSPPRFPADFLKTLSARVSFDAAWSVVGAAAR